MTEPNIPIQLTLKEPNDWGLPKKAAYLYIDTNQLPELVAEYVGLIEKEVTNRICKCEWIVHPEDMNKEEGKRRIRKGETALDCPVHTKEGFLIGFFVWVLANRESAVGGFVDVTTFDKPPMSETISTVVTFTSQRCDHHFGMDDQCTREMDHHGDHWPESYND